MSNTKTKYQIAVENGEMIPMNRLDSLVIGAMVETTLKRGSILDQEEVGCFEGVWIEIEHLYPNDHEKIAKMIQEFKNESK